MGLGFFEFSMNFLIESLKESFQILKEFKTLKNLQKHYGTILHYTNFNFKK